MDWLRKNAKTVIGALVILVLTESVLAWYLIQQFRENYLSGDEALGIALADAGLGRDAVRDVEIDLETDQGKAWYEIEFGLKNQAGTSYEYHVDAESGEILSVQND